jgi:energy-coupling factor transporter ATP-binding protein EcfA2
MEKLPRREESTSNDIRLLKESRFGIRYATVAPMLKKWRIRNFKSIKLAEIELAPLTVLVGANSAGKSSLLQSILLMAQNASQDAEIVTLSSRGSIFFNGQLVELGSIQECLHRDYLSPSLWEASQKSRDHSEAPTSTAQIGFGADFSFGRNFFKSKGGMQGTGRYVPEEIKWDFDLLSSNDDLEGIGQVSNAKLELSRKVEKVEVLGGITSVFVKGNNQENSVSDNPAFNKGYKTKVWENESFQLISRKKEVPQSQEENYDAISFSAGLPSKGLIEQSRIDVILEMLSSEWFGAIDSKVGFKGTYTSSLEVIVSKYLDYDEDEKLVPFDKNQLMTVPQAIEQALVSLFSILEEDANSDSDGQEASIRQRPLRSKLREMIDFTNIYWETLNAELQSNNNDLEQLGAFLDGTRGYDKDYLPTKDDQLRSEMRIFMDNLAIRAKTEFAVNLSAQEKIYVDPTDRTVRGSVMAIPATGKRIFNHVEYWNEYLKTKIKYIGPIREEAKAFYPYVSSTSITNQMPLGPKGEYLAQILYDSTLKQFPLPSHLKSSKNISILDAVNAWIPVLGLSGEVDVTPRGRQGIHLSYGDDVLPMVGTGVSQVLPVLVLCLTSNPGDLILLEQPELHLNPSIQQKLAEFFLAMSKTGRQLIVETHSEYLVTRLRLAGLKQDADQDLYKLLFVEKNGSEGTIYREVKSNSFGEIQEWPKGFFDQATNDIRELMIEISKRKIGNRSEN